MLVANGPGIAGGLFTHFGGRLARVQSANQDAILDQIVLSGSHALKVIPVRSQLAGYKPVINDIEYVQAKAFAQLHEFFHPFILIDKI